MRHQAAAGHHATRQVVFHDSVTVLHRALLLALPTQQTLAVPVHVADHGEVAPPQRIWLKESLLAPADPCLELRVDVAVAKLIL